MKSESSLLNRFIFSVRESQSTGALAIAVAIGLCGGYGSLLFRYMIGGCKWLFQEMLQSSLATVMGPWSWIIVVALGGLLVGLIGKFFAPETKGHGVPEVMLSVAYNGGRIRPRVAFFRAIAAAICIGSGGSAGREGPIVQIGATCASAIGQFFRLPDRRVTLAVACGAAAGIAATFNAPIAGVIFALEVILLRFTASSFGMVVISSITATIVTRYYLGENPAFIVHIEYGLNSNLEMALYLGLGILSALVAQAYMRLLYFVEDISDKIRIPEYFKPAVGGALVGLMAIWNMEALGTNYGMIEAVIQDGMAWNILLMLCVLKIVSTALTMGSGGSGGVFAPALYVGAMFGGAYGMICHSFMPDVVNLTGGYTIVGMAAVFAGAAHAPITAILIVYEMTGDYRIILPLMTSTVISTYLSQRISIQSIYTMKLHRRGIDIGLAQDVNLMDSISVGEAVSPDFEMVRESAPITSLITKFAMGHRTGFPVVDKDGALVGVVTKHDVENAIIDRNPDTITIKDICTRNVVVCRPDQSLSTALALLGTRGLELLPVINPEQPSHLYGVLHPEDAVSAYSRAQRIGSGTMEHAADAIGAGGERTAVVIVRETIKTGSALAGTLVRDAHFPQGSSLAAIQRANSTIIPSGSQKLVRGDEIEVVATRENAREVRKWLREHC